MKTEKPIQFYLKPNKRGDEGPTLRNSRQGCESSVVKVHIPSIARIGRLAYPGRGEVKREARSALESGK